MRSRSGLEHVGIVLGAAAEGIWCGALAAALTGASWAALAVFAWATVLAAALLARRLASGAGRERTARLLAVTLILVATGALLAAGGAWAHHDPLWQIVRDFVFVGGLVFLGVRLGRVRQSPGEALRLAVRAFALVCVVLAGAALAGSTPGWATAALVAALVVGGLLIAIVRYAAMSDLVDPDERLPAWPWLLAVAGCILGVVAAGALLGQVLRVDVLLWALGGLGGVLRYALDGAAFLIGYAGAGIIRGIAWLLGVLHLHARSAAEVPHVADSPPVLRLHREAGVKVWSGARLIGTALGALLAMGLALVLVLVALRRSRRELPADVAVVEEREAVATLSSLAAESAARWRRRLRRRLQTLRRHEQLTPAELVRRRYVELERRLSRAGRPRLPGVTVREHLAAVTALLETSASSLSQPATDLAAIYEVARYSAHTVDVCEAQRFEALARAFEV